MLLVGAVAWVITLAAAPGRSPSAKNERRIEAMRRLVALGAALVNVAGEGKHKIMMLVLKRRKGGIPIRPADYFSPYYDLALPAEAEYVFEDPKILSPLAMERLTSYEVPSFPRDAGGGRAPVLGDFVVPDGPMVLMSDGSLLELGESLGVSPSEKARIVSCFGQRLQPAPETR